MRPEMAAQEMAAADAQRARGPRLLRWLGIAAAIIALDQLTKLLILGHYQFGEGTPVTSFFNIVRVHNTGAAFSFLAQAGGWQRWFFTAIGVGAAAVIIPLLYRRGEERLLGWSLTLVLGGAIGNVIDRVLYGYVVDFLDFHAAGRHFPAFNVADMAISVGAALLILDEVLRMRRSR